MKKIIAWANRAFHPEQTTGRNVEFVTLFRKFQQILAANNRSLELIAEANDKLGGQYVFDKQYIHTLRGELAGQVQQLIYNLEELAPHKYAKLHDVFRRINSDIEEELAGRLVISGSELVMPYDRIDRDYLNLVGGKNTRLAEMKTILGLKVPEGFAVTTRAFQLFMEENGLWEKVLPLSARWREGKMAVGEASGRIRTLIRRAAIPAVLKKAIQTELGRLRQLSGKKHLSLAVRSSAWGEDSELSFAGQYLSKLNVAEDDIFDCYKEVIASLFSPRAMEYRQRHGFGSREMAMAVACQLMVDAKVSGVIYTTSTSASPRDSLMLSASWGLGEPVVSGEVSGDQYMVSRRTPHRISEVSLVRKTRQLVAGPQGGTKMVQVEERLRDTACLQRDDIYRLADVALQIEQFFRAYMDIEFAIDRQGELVLLQARPLNLENMNCPQTADILHALKRYPVILRDRGVIAQKGIGAGKVWIAGKNSDLDAFPSGAILVARSASPLYARVMNRAAGVITDVGSATCHMATIAREFRVPTLVNTGNATEILQDGMDITIDAEENIVYQGMIDELCDYGLTTERIEETYEYRLLRRVLKKIEPLFLIEPTDRNFTPAGCRTFHDIIRFVHEKAVEELINLHFNRRHEPASVSGTLRWELPLDMVLIDIGGGLASPPRRGRIEVGEIVSLPMQAMLEGLATPGAWDNEPLSVDLGSFMASLTRTFAAEHASPKYAGQNLAVISKEYANISFRLGYHFSMIDAYVSDNFNDNYVYFRFVGGVTDAVRRSRRANLLKNILSENDFLVEVHGDLVVARIKKLAAADILDKIRLLGRLVGYTRQLDVQLVSDRHIRRYVTGFENLAGENSNG